MKFKPDLLMSKNIVPNLLKGTYTVPDELDLRYYALKTENQGSTPTCAAHAATSFIEQINYRKTQVRKDLDPYKLYEYAKKIDGYPNEDGTTLDAVLKGCIKLGWINRKESDVVCFSGIDEIKKMVHRYGPLLLGFNVSELWMNHYGKLVMDGNLGRSLGGHAVICFGYKRSGLLIQNSWGNSWGKYGFACIPWNICNVQLQYAGIIKNYLNDLN